MIVYLDTSALIKLYIAEAEQPLVQAYVSENPGMLFTSIVTYAEVFAALAKAVRESRLGAEEHPALKSTFQQHWSGINAIEVTKAVLQPAERVVDRYALRGFDAVQLCCALWMKPDRPKFACFDSRLRAAAAAEGLEVIP